MSIPSPVSRRRRGSSRWLKQYTSRRAKSVLLGLAALPLCQTSGCYPDFLAGLSFELQMLVNTFVINTANIIIQNLLGL